MQLMLPEKLVIQCAYIFLPLWVHMSILSEAFDIKTSNKMKVGLSLSLD